MPTLEQWQAGAQSEGYPPWDGTGIPFPLDANGWPDLPGDEGVGVVTTVPTGNAGPAATTAVVVTLTTPTDQTGDQFDVFQSINGQPLSPTGSSFTQTGPTTWEYTAPAGFYLDGDSVVFNAVRTSDTAQGTASAPVIFAGVVGDPNMGWTKAELIQFAADHEPPIPVPLSGTKAEILAAILAYIAAHPEEN